MELILCTGIVFITSALIYVGFKIHELVEAIWEKETSQFHLHIKGNVGIQDEQLQQMESLSVEEADKDEDKTTS